VRGAVFCVIMINMGKYYIGTSGYSYNDWVGPFYQEGTKQSDFLSYYASHFPFVELNFSYYRQPSAHMLSRMIDKTPAGFFFSIKAHQSLTHQVTADWGKETDTFLKGITPLLTENRLAAVLLQFPYSFHYTAENRKYLADLCSRFSELPTLVEFRNREWQKEEVYNGLRERNLGLVVTDSPDLKGLPFPETIVTSSYGYIRFHGRNRKNWWHGDSESRYDYLYSEEELEEWIPKIAYILGKTTVLFIAFNNHRKGQAVQNAIQLQRLLKEREMEVSS